MSTPLWGDNCAAGFGRVGIAMPHRLRELREARNWSKPRAAEALGYSPGGYTKIESGERKISVQLVQRAAAVYGVSPEFVMGTAPEQPKVQSRLTAGSLPASNVGRREALQAEETGETIPVYGQAMGGEHGEFILNGNRIADILAPTILRGVPGAYAVHVVGDSMEPRYDAGEVVFVHPHLPVRRGNYVVVQIAADPDGPPHGYIKQFVAKTADVIRLRQLNPDQEIEFPAGRVVSVHRIVGAQYGA